MNRTKKNTRNTHYWLIIESGFCPEQSTDYAKTVKDIASDNTSEYRDTPDYSAIVADIASS